jgi:two-component system, chemotaxis family, chemotaxis protein CheY
MLVLLVEDEPVIRQMVRRMLQQAGHEVVEGANGQEGLQHLEALAIELVLTDIDMPVMNGIAFIKQARLLRPSLIMIAMSGGGRTDGIDHLQAACAHGASATLRKPFRAADLRQAIAHGFERTLAQNA